MRTCFLLIALLHAGCAARGPRADEGPDPRLLEADLAWEDRGVRGLDPVETALVAGMRKGKEDDPAYLWRHARMLVERGMAEQDQRRAALDSFAAARGQAFHCLNRDAAWRLRRDAGLESALETVDGETQACLTWATVAWARWLVMMGGDAGALDLDEVQQMAAFVGQLDDEQARDLGRWAGALVSATRPEWLKGDRAKARARLERAVNARPRDLIRAWDLLVLVAIPDDDPALQAQLKTAIREGEARTDVDRAVKAWVAALDVAPPTRMPATE